MKFIAFSLVGASLSLAFSGCATSSNQKKVPPETPSWIAQSNEIATQYSRSYATISPESGSSLGFKEFDSKAECLQADSQAKVLEHSAQWITRLQGLEAATADLEYKTDLAILRQSLLDHESSVRVDRKYNVVSFVPVSKVMFGNLRQLVNDQADSARKSAAVERFKAYVQPVQGCLSLANFGEQKVKFEEKRSQGRKRIYSLKVELEQYLKESEQYQKGVKDLLAQSGRSDWQDLYSQFVTQVKGHDEYLRKKVLPRTRTSFQVPNEVYREILKQYGVHEDPDALIKRGRETYQAIFKNFEALAKNVATSRKLTVKTPAAVIQELKKQQVTNVDDLKAKYFEADRRLKEIIETHQIVTLPAAPLKIRFAGEAESKAVPVPILRPAPLVGNKGERPEFVVPTSETGTPPFDDFSYPASFIGVLAHEGRPGHDLQFSSMLDRGVSLIRARYAFNSANAEGWGSHAEDLIYPHVSDEEKLVFLQMRLWRVARMFLDPGVQLGKIKLADARKVLQEELGISPVMTQLELNRYTFDGPGQNTAYYYGLELIRKARANAKAALGPRYTDRCFHDFVLSLGLLPLDELIRRSSSIQCSGGT